jgi:uncharacterized protein with HEPN domain
MLRRAAERALQIISEAAKTLPPELTARYPQAPWHAIVGIGNVLRHEYQAIDDRRLWNILIVHLPQLRPVIPDHDRRARAGQRSSWWIVTHCP